MLRDQPPKIFDYIANYLSVLLITREHGILALKIMEDLCDCRASVSEHLLQLGLERPQAETLSQIIKEEIEGFEPVEGKEKVKETQILKKVLTRTTLDEDMSAKVCQVARNAYRDYWYRKKMMEKNLKVHPDEPWEIAAEHTLELYKRTKPSFTELTRATQKIQAAYRGYHVRRNMLRHLKAKPKKTGPKVELPGAPLDVAGSREIDLGPVIDIKVREDDVTVMFDENVGQKLGLQYDPMRTITHVEDQDDEMDHRASRVQSRVSTATKSRSQSKSGQVAVEETMSRHSQVSQVNENANRQSRLPSQLPVSTNVSLHKISFAEVSPEVIADEVPEELPAADIPAEADVAQEVPEDIPDDRTEGDGQSEPTASVPSSVVTTDVEDGGEPTDDGEE